MELSDIIKKPLITEKTMVLTKQDKYTFYVDKRANKNLIKKAVEKFFPVEVKKVWLIKVLGKTKRTGRYRRRLIKKSDWKKAIVQVNPEQSQRIDLFDQAQGQS
jgi:large subunit ribosomal protein L23